MPTPTSQGERPIAIIGAGFAGVDGLSRPRTPDVEGLDTFGGEWFHSSRWKMSCA